MRLKTQRKAIYVAMGLTVLALTGGYALASVSLGQTNSVQQGSQTTTISEVKGLSWNATDLVILNASNGPAGTACTAPSGCNVSASAASDCAGGVSGAATCAPGTWVEKVTLNTTAGGTITGVVNITLYVTVGGTTTAGTSFYYSNSKVASGNGHELIIQDFGVGTAASGPQAVTSVSIVINTYT